MVSLVRVAAALCMVFVLTTISTISATGGATLIAPYYGYSFNWSGYAIVVGGETFVTPAGNMIWVSTEANPIYPYTVSYVYGEWTVPEIVPGTTGFMADVAVWVGIDGYDSNTVEQIGTSSEYNPYTGEITYWAWWEVYPKFSHRIRAMTVNPGHEIEAYVKFIPVGKSPAVPGRGTFILSLTDRTTGESFRIVQGANRPGLYQRSSAEWVVERGAFYNPSTKLAYFAELSQFDLPVEFTDCQATITAPDGVPINYDRMWMIAPIPPDYGYGDAYGSIPTTFDQLIIAETALSTGDLTSGGSFTVSWIPFDTQEAVLPWPYPTPEGS
ncbi:MAG: G1 family endopeptidase [Aigarchaeota archaeon]|nr:G1 family endopeptidase [Aigarchaeota archaeon]